MFQILAQSFPTVSNTIGVGTGINLMASAGILAVLIRKYGNEIEYLRDQLQRRDADLLAERNEKRELNEGIRKEVVPALTEVAHILPIVIDRLTK